MSLSLLRSLLYVGVHPLESAHRCYDAVFTTGSGVVRETVDALSALSHRSLHVAALAPALLDVLHTPAAEEVATAVVALVKATHALLQCEHVPALLRQLLALLCSPASREAVDAASAALLAVLRLCRTPQVEGTSAQMTRAIQALHAQVASTAVPNSALPRAEGPLSHAQWMDCLAFLLRPTDANSRWRLSSDETSAAMERVRVKDEGLAVWWLEMEIARRAVEEGAAAVARERKGYGLEGEADEEKVEGESADAVDERCSQQLRQLLQR